MTDMHPDRKDDEKGMLGTAVDKTKEMATYVADSAKDAFHTLVGGGDDDAKKKVEDGEQCNRTMIDATKEKANDAWLKTQEMAGETKEKANDAWLKTQEMAGEAKEKVEETLRGAREAGEQGYTDAHSCAEQKGKDARKQLAAQLDKVARHVEG